LLLILVFALIAAACSGGDDDVATTTTIEAIETIEERSGLATVNGADIPVIDITKLHVDFGELQSQEIADSVLLLVLNEVLYDEADTQFALVPSEGDIAAAFETHVDSYGTVERMNAVLESQNETSDRLQLESQLDALRTLLARHLVISETQGFDIDLAFKNYLLTESTVCVRHIQVLTEEGFDLVRGRVDAGEDFATVALENSLDPLVARTDGGSGAGGDLGCRTPASTPFPEAALDAVVGELSGPVFTDAGTHLIQVYERDAPELDDVRGDVLEVGVLTQGPGLFNDWAVRALQAADVTIDEAFGSWGVLPATDGVPTVIPAGG